MSKLIERNFKELAQTLVEYAANHSFDELGAAIVPFDQAKKLVTELVKTNKAYIHSIELVDPEVNDYDDLYLISVSKGLDDEDENRIDVFCEKLYHEEYNTGHKTFSAGYYGYEATYLLVDPESITDGALYANEWDDVEIEYTKLPAEIIVDSQYEQIQEVRSVLNQCAQLLDSVANTVSKICGE